jgi:NDP-sugar pyrophosphorylase family protein
MPSESHRTHTPAVRRAALIAAGLGERLRSSGGNLPKPLVPVDGVPLIDHVFARVAATGIRDVACIFNAEADAVEEHCRRTTHGLQLQIVRRSTPSSMESLFALAPYLQDGPFLLLTVDAVFGPAVLPQLLRGVHAHPDADGVLGVHDFIDDEKPLRVRVDATARITAIGPGADDSSLITAGLYVFSPRIFTEIDAARGARLAALRQFLAHLVARDYRLYAAALPKTIDVDRPEDVAAAEAFVRAGFR